MEKGKQNTEPAKGSRPVSADDFFTEVESDLESMERSETVRVGAQISEQLQKTERRLIKLEMLIDITRALNSTLNLNELLAQIVDSTIKLADTERGFLMLANKKGELEFRIARNSAKQPLSESDFEVSHSIINDVSQRGEPLYISNLLENDRFKDQQSVIDLQLRAAICVPLILDESTIGVIYTASSRVSPEFTKEDLPIVSAFAAQAAMAIENARLHGELILSRENLARENIKLKQVLSEKYEFAGIIGKSKEMKEIFMTIQKIAPLTSTVLIKGETGTGKELIARAIHFNGPRHEKQLVTINCGAMPAELLESELFGHKKGSFTGANTDKAGLFETANGGTIFLDEIGDMPVPLQVKLLRAIQEGEIRRVGENYQRNVDVRVIAASNRDLEEDVKAGLFRQDLFYRLNVVPITIPPLRDRKDDILPLAEHFLNKYSTKMDKLGVKIDPDAMKLLLVNIWTGNVRELENTIERALALSGNSSVLAIEHFPQLQTDNGLFDQLEKRKSLKEKLRAVEKQLIIEALEKTSWKITKAAELLEVTRQHLHNKIKQYQIDTHR